jgi:glycine dehydrogenase
LLPISLVKLTPPGEIGAAVVVKQHSVSESMGYGGPHAAYFATKKSISVPCQEESLVSQDANGNRALRMALQTREQHIKREKSNI